MQGLLNTEENEKTIFMKEKFPKEWEIATNNTKEEIREMINQWRILL